MQRLLIATRNTYKTREIQEILGPEFDAEDLSAHPGIANPTESGKTFAENAILKAVEVSKQSQQLVIADDSGLEVDALDGAPGVLSARYSGQGASDRANVAKLLGELERLGTQGMRRARFRCVIALAHAGKLLATFDGAVEGQIGEMPRGKAGFGYDPVFFPKGFGETFAELSPDVKNRISHRARALRKLKRYFRESSVRSDLKE